MRDEHRGESWAVSAGRWIDGSDRWQESSWKISERHLPTSVNCFYQLCHIEIPGVAELIREAPLPMEASAEYGWFCSDVPNDIRGLIQRFVADKVVYLTKNPSAL